jgi:hypothetical protein
MALKDPEQEKLLLKVGKKKSKYRNQKVELDGIKFDSIAEAARWIQLKDRERKKEIFGLYVKPVYKFKTGVKYIPDFLYFEKSERARTGFAKKIIEDVKGFSTEAFKIKKKLMLSEYKIVVEVIKIPANVANNLVRAYLGNQERKSEIS